MCRFVMYAVNGNLQHEHTSQEKRLPSQVMQL